MIWLLSVLFFKEEDGIRDADVTGVQTCALPISVRAERLPVRLEQPCRGELLGRIGQRYCREEGRPRLRHPQEEIGRASCRERGEISVGAGSLKKKRKNSMVYCIARRHTKR